MNYPSPHFVYNNTNRLCEYNGLQFDSLLELKFALMIEDDYAYLREGIRIYYQPRTCVSTNRLNENTRIYYPDFLIRDFKTKQAFLVEIKPDNFDLIGLLEHRTRIVNHFIRTNGYDWTFQTIYENEIVLSDRKQEKFESLIFMLNETESNHTSLLQSKSILQLPILKYPVDVPGNRSMIKNENQYRLFVRRGKGPPNTQKKQAVE